MVQEPVAHWSSLEHPLPEAVHVPLMWPHWVKNVPEPSVSFSITWKSDWIYQEADVRGMNHLLRRFGIDLSVQTMCGWMGQCAGLLDPLYLCLKDFVLSSKVVGTDDTPVKVLDRNLPHTRKGRIWPYIGDRDHPGAICAAPPASASLDAPPLSC